MATAAQILSCSFDRWHLDFTSLPKRSAPDLTATDDEYREWSDDDSNSSAESDVQGASSWPAVAHSIEQAIAELGGRVVPKLNWSCPKDATWVTASNSIACTNADEVLLLLKSSDRIAHDICHAFDSCPNKPEAPVRWVLVLKKQYDLKPDREFRCFIKSHDLVGICQRDVTQHFPALRDQQDDIEERILDFFEEHVQHKFPSADYTMDVYVATSGMVKLMDFNPIGGSTVPLLFEWDELGYGSCMTSEDRQDHQEQQNGHAATDSVSATMRSGSELAQGDHSQRLDFRILTEPVPLRPNKGVYGVPYDLVDTSQGSAVTEMLQQLREADTALAAMSVVDAAVTADE